MEITRKSMLTGLTTTRELPITDAQYQVWQAGQLIQDAFPQLSPADREFFLTGITESEWETMGWDDEEDA
jgi:hypothetical protein